MLRLIFFFNDTATTEIYTLSLHDALPIYRAGRGRIPGPVRFGDKEEVSAAGREEAIRLGCSERSEEHTSELQSRLHLVCRLLLEKKNKTTTHQTVGEVHVVCQLEESRLCL